MYLNPDMEAVIQADDLKPHFRQYAFQYRCWTVEGVAKRAGTSTNCQRTARCLRMGTLPAPIKAHNCLYEAPNKHFATEFTKVRNESCACYVALLWLCRHKQCLAWYARGITT